MKKEFTVIILCAGLLIGCSNQQVPSVEIQANENVQAKEDAQVLALEKEVNPIIDAELLKHFKEKRLVKGVEIDVVDMDAFNKVASMYIDRKNKQYVFLVENENSEAIEEIQKNLEEKLETKVKFKKAKYSLDELIKIKDEIFFKEETMKIFGAGIGANETIVISGDLTDKEKNYLLTKYGVMLIFEYQAEPSIEF